MTREEKLIATRAYLGAFTTENAISEEAHRFREEAVAALPALIPEFREDEIPADLLCCAYMLSSYCEHPDKHALKPHVIEFFRRELERFGITGGINPPPKRAKPRIVVVATFMGSNHTMFRVFAKALREMKKRFETVGIVFTPIDNEAAQIFSRVIVAPPVPSEYFTQIARLVDLIRAQAPDAIVYADTAMHPFSICTSALRLAPLQILWAGHPSSSYAPEMDYFMCEDYFGRGLAGFTEAWALVDTNRCAFTPLPQIGIERAPREPGPVRIVIPGVLPKITHPFLRAVAQIEKSIPECEIHITTGCGAERNFPVAEANIKAIVPAAKCYAKLPYEMYLRLIDQCDLFLNPFPFGGCSTVMDCVVRGLPGVSMIGNEYFSLQAPMVMHRCGLPEFSTLARTEREYIARAINLAVNNPLRRAYTEELRRTRPLDFPVFTDRADGFANAIAMLLQRSEQHGQSRHAYPRHAVHA